ncbi:MAG: hypothetical protein GY762_20935 [Proteobacteria bacterium]|nr:hypothetical protein [Pseudomonadota bacterium]
MTVRQPIEEEYLDVFQNIEAVIVAVYRETPELTNWDVENAIEALLRQYQAEWRGMKARPVHLSTERKRDVYDAVRSICEWRLGRSPAHTKDDEVFPLPGKPLSLEEIVAILKRLRKSVRFWQKQGGRQGYLQYTDRFIP